MGPSGAGKSTLVDHLAGLLRPDRGRVLVGDRDVWSVSNAELTEMRRGMSVMLGGSSLYETSIFGSLTVLDNLCYSLGAHGVPEEQRVQRAMDQLGRVDLHDAARGYPHQLPAHARKRLALARALVLDAPLTVLDEIDAGMDAEHVRLAVRAVRELRERTGCTLLVTTHNLTLAAELADHLAILHNARIVTSGDPGELLRDVHTAEDFDRSFVATDFAGPPRLEDVRNEENPTGFSVTIDPRVVVPLVVGMVLVVALAAVYLLRHQLGLS